MSGSFTRKWTDEQRAAIVRRVLDEGQKVTHTVREAHAGELREDTRGPKLRPFPIPIATARKYIDDERAKRRATMIAKAALTDPDVEIREMLRSTMAETKAELERMHSWLRSGSKRRGRSRQTAWDDLTAAAKVIEQLARASAATDRPAPKNRGVQTPPEKPRPSLVTSLAQTRPVQTHTATAQGLEPTTKRSTHVPEAEQPTDEQAERGTPVPWDARSNGAA